MKLLYNIVAGIFTFVAKVYDVMLTLARSGTDAGSISDYPIADVATVMYTIAGVFMLFRVTIAMINMLINPDAVSDSKAGAGKLVTRIITVIVLLLLFVPNGFMFGETGILNRLEQALLAPDGLINNIIPSSISGASGDITNDENTNTNVNTSTNTNTNNETANTVNEGTNNVKDNAEQAAENVTNQTAMSGVIEDVYAAGETLDCYYFYKDANQINSGGGQYTVGENTQQTIVNKKIKYNATKGLFHIRFYNQSSSNTDYTKGRAALCTKWTNNPLAKTPYKNCDKMSYELIVDDAQNENPLYRSQFPNKPGYNGLIGSHFSKGWKTTCPHIIAGGTVYYNAKTGKTNSYKTQTSGIVGGWHSHAAMAKVILEETTSTGNEEDKKTAEEEIGVKTLGQETADAYANANNPLQGISEEAVNFAQTTMGTFLSCTGSTNCEAYASQILISSTADAGVAQDLAANPPTMHLDFIPALIAGVGILIWVLVMCVDVIVRRFKLLLLQMIAPIPIISYVDPNDKMFDKWKDMFIATYLDLFIKLIAISFAIYLLQLVGGVGRDINLILKFFYIVAILVFAKAVPSIISEIFGLKNMGGSFKDITGMAKAAAGFGAGAVLGAGVGAISGLGAGGNPGMAALGALRGAAMGAGSGSKGNVFGGAKNIASTNKAIREANRNGSTMAGRVGVRARNFFGLDNAAEVEASDIERERINLEPDETAINNAQEAIDARKRALEPDKHTQQNHQNYQSNVKAFGDRVEKFMGYHKYDHLAEVQDYWNAKSAYDSAYTTGRLADGSEATSADLARLQKVMDGSFYTAAQASKDYEIAHGTDAEAQMYLENVRDIGNDLGGNFANFTSWQNDLQQLNASSADLSNDIGNRISRTEYQISLDQEMLDQRKRGLDRAKYDLDVRERNLKRSGAQANVDAVNGTKK